MKILKVDSTNLKTGEKLEDKEFFLSIINEILSICKEDKNLAEVNSNIDFIEPELKGIESKVEKQNILLTKSKEIRDDLLLKIEILQNENNKKRDELLESLGSMI